jgi:phenylpyruvate tautomerase PptA (4-oxalocrotonate tautomerase family)
MRGSPRSESPSSSPFWRSRKGELVDELAEAAADHYHLNYSKHPVPVLFREVRAARTLLAGVLPAGTDGTQLHRQLGRLSGLLGNLAFHLDDPAGARIHLGTAVSYANRCGDTALAAWAYGRRAWWPATPAT